MCCIRRLRGEEAESMAQILKARPRALALRYGTDTQWWRRFLACRRGGRPMSEVECSTLSLVSAFLIQLYDRPVMEIQIGSWFSLSVSGRKTLWACPK
jgi:hypothetical protein